MRCELLFVTSDVRIRRVFWSTAEKCIRRVLQVCMHACMLLLLLFVWECCCCCCCCCSPPAGQPLPHDLQHPLDTMGRVQGVGTHIMHVTLHTSRVTFHTSRITRHTSRTTHAPLRTRTLTNFTRHLNGQSPTCNPPPPLPPIHQTVVSSLSSSSSSSSPSQSQSPVTLHAASNLQKATLLNANPNCDTLLPLLLLFKSMFHISKCTSPAIPLPPQKTKIEYGGGAGIALEKIFTQQ